MLLADELFIDGWLGRRRTAGPEPSTQYLAITDRIMFSGRGPVDAIVPGSGDPRQTLTALLPDGPRLWRKAGIPGAHASPPGLAQRRWSGRHGPAAAGADRAGQPL